MTYFPERQRFPAFELSNCKRYGKGMFTTIYPELADVLAEDRIEHEIEMRRYFAYRRIESKSQVAKS